MPTELVLDLWTKVTVVLGRPIQGYTGMTMFPQGHQIVEEDTREALATSSHS